MNIALIGYGRMGKEIERIARDRNIRVHQVYTSKGNSEGEPLTKKALAGVDVCIEFSSPSTVLKNITTVASCGKNMVVGTTGWYEKLKEVERIVRKEKIGLLYSPNFSIGINIFYHILTNAAHYINTFDQYDIAIQETHHRGKADSPSGTALSISQIILQQVRRKVEILHETAHREMKPNQLHVTSTRVGNVVGTHTVLFDSEADTIELTHRAKNRAGFALGALIAAEWLRGKKGIYTMNDVLSSL